MQQDSFDSQIISILPQLKMQAMALTRNWSEAEDLVQEAICNALIARHSFTMGTNFPAWMYRIVRNRFISNLRKKKETVTLDSITDQHLSTQSHNDDYLVLKELIKAAGFLSEEQREALMMIALDGLSYEELAKMTNCAVGTAKSRVFRARRQLEINSTLSVNYL